MSDDPGLFALLIGLVFITGGSIYAMHVPCDELFGWFTAGMGLVFALMGLTFMVLELLGDRKRR